MNQKTVWMLTIALVLLIIGGSATVAVKKHQSSTPIPASPVETIQESRTIKAPEKNVGNFILRSPAYTPDPESRTKFPLDYTCFRKNKTPPLSWSGSPIGTKSFALVMARQQKNGLFWNWAAYNIPASLTELEEGLPAASSLKKGVSFGYNDYGQIGYTGPCAPKGTEIYTLTLFALDDILDIPDKVDRKTLSAAMERHIIDSAELSVYHYYLKP